MALTNKLTAIADAIRGKTGKTEEMTLDQMATEIAGIQSGGDTAMEDGLVARTLTEYTNDRVTTIGGHAFYSNTALTSVSFPNVTTIEGINNFQGCTALTSIDFPKLELASGGNTFRQCTSLTEVVLPSLLGFVPSFRGCEALRQVDVTIGRRYPASAPRISNTTFDGATMLNRIIIRTDEVVVLDNIGAFTGTPFASGGTGGTVYVPSALISSYQTATNWSTLYAAGTCNFVAIEGSEYE